MSARLEADNFNSINIKTQSLLDVASIVGATSIMPQSTSGFATNDFIFLGNTGKDQVEKCFITVASPLIDVVDPLAYQHDRFEPIIDVYGDQIQFYSAPDPGTGFAPADGAFSTLSTPISIVPGTLVTQYIDPSGGSNFWYKYVYWNSMTDAATSSLSDLDAVRGGDIGLYIDVDSVRQEAGFRANKNITDSYIASFIVKANDHINSKLGGTYAVPFLDPVPETIRNVAKLYAAGLMLNAQYGVFAQGSQVDGEQKIKDADALLLDLQTSASDVFDQAGNSLRIFAPVAGWPDDTTFTLGETDDNGNPTAGGGAIFKITHIF